MQVYVEYALLENFCMDFALLFCAKAITKNQCRYLRIVFAALFGACFAVVFPLFRLNGALATVIKLVAGAVMCAFGGKFSRITGYLKFAAVFAAATFALGGALIALFSLCKTEYTLSGGVILSSVPVGVPLFAAVLICILCKKLIAKALAKRGGGSYKCVLRVGEKSAECTAFYDSGNRVYRRGVPVCVVDASIAEKLVEIKGIKTFVEIHTVTGKADMAVFTADEVKMDDGKSVAVIKNVLFGVSPRRIKKAVMHPDVAEVN